MDKFIFEDIKDIHPFLEEAYVFNALKKDIEKEVFTLVSFEDERLGSSKEKLDIAIQGNNGEYTLCKSDVLTNTDYNEIPLSFFITGKPYKSVLVISRMMSNMLLDKVNHSSHSVVYVPVHSDFKDIDKYKGIQGKFAKCGIYLNMPKEEVEKSINLKYNSNKELAEELISDVRKVAGDVNE